RSRTLNLWSRNPALYPVELWVQKFSKHSEACLPSGRDSIAADSYAKASASACEPPKCRTTLNPQSLAGRTEIWYSTETSDRQLNYECKNGVQIYDFIPGI
ncbi:MAG: hypothetical protein RLN96_08665, partial [Pseudomonadales bacterium]